MSRSRPPKLPLGGRGSGARSSGTAPRQTFAIVDGAVRVIVAAVRRSGRMPAKEHLDRLGRVDAAGLRRTMKAICDERIYRNTQKYSRLHGAHASGIFEFKKG